MLKNPSRTHSLLYMSFALAAGTLLLGFASRFYWFFDLISHFRLYHALVFFGLALIGIVLRLKTLAVAAFMLTLLILLPLARYYLPKSECTGIGSTKLISLNLLSENDDYSAVGTFIASEDPDIVITTELTADWLVQLQDAMTDYPYRIHRTREDHFGIGLFSKFPFDTSEIRIFDHLGVPAVRADLALDSELLTVIGIHPIPPFRRLRHRLRDAQLISAIELARSSAHVDVIIGDFNCTSFSGGYRRSLRESGLKDSRLGFGWQHSWYSRLPGIHLAIDHAWVSKELCVLDRRLGPDIGSDHLPVVLEIRR